ncbi:bifunctional chorismate mutase/prephenate dehydratase [Butyricicoccus sp.]|uniref:bifunctional chorismate mutase/prephenate dehydratase n=1 Tax=Butyricicoccus sp. TaxID=2049021 RepID=UPI003F1620DC
MRKIEDIRRDINAIDHEILKLFLKRMKCAEEVSDYKMANGGQVLVPSRETELLDTMLKDIPDELKLEYSSLLRTTTRVSRKHQYFRMLEAEPERLKLDIQPRISDPKMVYYGGLPASYQDMACSELFPNAQKRPMESWEDVFRAVVNGEADAGVVPVENSTAGTVNEIYDLLQQYGLYISHSHVKVIRHCIAGCKGASLDSIKEVYSHPQALRQCQNYIKKHAYTPFEESNTAVAANKIAQLGDPTKAAICSEAAAKLYGLEILETGVNDGDYNQTRFIAVQRALSAQPEDTRVSLVLTLPHVVGSLYGSLAVFADYGLNMTEIHSRPLPDMPWNYCFYIDFDGNLLNQDTRALIYQLTQECAYVRVLGSYPVSQEEGTK